MNRVIAIQSRMSSKRFPGKALKQIQGIPLLGWVIANSRNVGLPTWVVTSQEPTDDSLCDYSISQGVNVYRGSLNDVWSRYSTFAAENNIDRVIRINGDSPLISPEVISRAVKLDSLNPKSHLVSNVFPRTFPKGQSVEIIDSETMLEIHPSSLSDINREHITSFFYERSQEFEIINFTNDVDLSSYNLCIDLPSDLTELEYFLNRNNILEPQSLPRWDNLEPLVRETWGKK